MQIEKMSKPFRPPSPIYEGCPKYEKCLPGGSEFGRENCYGTIRQSLPTTINFGGIIGGTVETSKKFIVYFQLDG